MDKECKKCTHGSFHPVYIFNGVEVWYCTLFREIKPDMTYCDKFILRDSCRNDPPYYTRLNPQQKDVARKWNLNSNLAMVLKYISRAGHKDKNPAVLDLKKAIRFLEFEIEYLEAEDREALEELRQSDDSSTEAPDSEDNSSDYFGIPE
jgi:hypothetical protein